MPLDKLKKEYLALKSQWDNLLDELKRSKYNENKLSCVINDEKSSIRQIRDTIKSLQETCEDLDVALENHEKELSDVHDKIRHLNIQIPKIEQ